MKIPMKSAVNVEVLHPNSCMSAILDDANLTERSLSHDLRWLQVLQHGLQHEPYLLRATYDGCTAGILPLALVRSLLFGRFLVSLPYLNSVGVQASELSVRMALVDGAVKLADELRVQHLELRQETEIDHPALTEKLTNKVHMRLKLPADAEHLWSSFDPKVRNQIRKGEKQEFETVWGSEPLLAEFYHVFSLNMRDLGTPVYSQRLFQSILRQFPDEAELCVIRLKKRPVAAALLMHGPLISEVPSASSLREFNATNANMFMYWQLLKRAIEQGQEYFDFGRSSEESGTYRFKKQWGAQPSPAVWQYYVRRGSINAVRPENSKYQRAIRAWTKLPVWVTRLIGPLIVRGIP